MPSEKPTVFIVDDEPPIINALGNRLRAEGFDIRTFSSAEELLAAEIPPRSVCFVLDIRLPVVDGLQLLRELRNRGCCAPVIMISAYGDASTAVRALKEGAADYFEKPLDVQELIRRIREVLNENRSQGALTRLTKRLNPEEARTLFREIAPALVLTILAHIGRPVDLKVVARAADHLCHPDVQNRLRRLTHVREGLIDELASFLGDASIRASRESLMDVIQATGAVHRLTALEACLVHSGAA